MKDAANKTSILIKSGVEPSKAVGSVVVHGTPMDELFMRWYDSDFSDADLIAYLDCNTDWDIQELWEMLSEAMEKYIRPKVMEIAKIL